MTPASLPGQMKRQIVHAHVKDRLACAMMPQDRHVQQPFQCLQIRVGTAKQHERAIKRAEVNPIHLP